MRTNPIRHTVTHYIEAHERRERRELERISKKRMPKKKDERSKFVRFLGSIENRTPKLSMRSELHLKWTRKVRKQMEKAGTWPKPDQELDIAILAEYLSRLQRVFWNEFPWRKWYNVDWYHERDYNEHPYGIFAPYRKVLRKIWLIFRRKGLRDHSFRISDWRAHTPSVAWVGPYKDLGGIPIRPYTPWNDHGLDI